MLSYLLEPAQRIQIDTALLKVCSARIANISNDLGIHVGLDVSVSLRLGTWLLLHLYAM